MVQAILTEGTWTYSRIIGQVPNPSPGNEQIGRGAGRALKHFSSLCVNQDLANSFRIADHPL